MRGCERPLKAEVDNSEAPYLPLLPSRTAAEAASSLRRRPLRCKKNEDDRDRFNWGGGNEDDCLTVLSLFRSRVLFRAVLKV